jgi:hypothetical protein
LKNFTASQAKFYFSSLHYLIEQTRGATCASRNQPDFSVHVIPRCDADNCASTGTPFVPFQMLGVQELPAGVVTIENRERLLKHEDNAM